MRSTAPPHRLIGYARVSTGEQDTHAQRLELEAAGCSTIVQERGSGASRTRPELARLLQIIQPGDILIVVRLDRLARSVSHLLEVIESLERKGAHFRSLHDPIDTSTPQGMFSLQVLGAVAQLERALIAERTKAGMAAARARGRLPGNPGLRNGSIAARHAVGQARDRAYLNGLLGSVDRWLPTVQRLRPHQSWSDVARILNGRGLGPWTTERLRRAVKRLVQEKLADPALLAIAPRRTSADRLAVLIQGIAQANPDLSLRAIAAQLEAMHERTPRGGHRWNASSVKHLLGRGLQTQI
ncbi:recombinase family protein [Marinivivus vitaminiproducens]|uniref:recombinase family protein n=1 Tax=Marinivivus vitaminiproducens TaxID=3035935 RepID=UPI0027A8426B|nr:recombinase family protein [Geminicoccaceae bacterium SCSIO 64248]